MKRVYRVMRRKTVREPPRAGLLFHPHVAQDEEGEDRLATVSMSTAYTTVLCCRTHSRALEVSRGDTRA